jgi:hypothetical protein
MRSIHTSFFPPLSLWLVTMASAAILSSAGVVYAVDICGCAGSAQSLGEFRSSIENTYPPGTMRTGSTITIPLPEGGKLIFDSFALDGTPGDPSTGVTLRFNPSPANDPVYLLVAGDFAVESGNQINVSGTNGSNGGGDQLGVGGLGGPGGFRGGDGGYEQVLLTPSGGPGLGPGGGAPGTPGDPGSALNGSPGTFIGNDQLMPLLGGSGGGGGSTYRSTDRAGGGGGGGGALLIAANGTIRVDGYIRANGGSGGSGTSGGYGGSGSGGAIRLLADAIEGDGFMYAISNGAIRMEVDDPFKNTLGVSRTSPLAQRDIVGQVFPLSTPKLRITSVGGQPVSELPQGFKGSVDVSADGANPVDVQIASQELPAGTNVEVRAKYQVGGDAIVTTTTLGNCDAELACTASASLDLPAGHYFLEAVVTFR